VTLQFRAPLQQRKAQSLVVTYFEIGVIRDQQSSPSENAVCSIYRHTGVAALRRFDAH